MAKSRADRVNRSPGLYLASGFAALAAATYFIVAAGLAPGDPAAPPAGVMLLAGLAYLVGAGLILFTSRRLLMLGAILNPLAILAFFVAFLLGNAEIEIVSLVSKFAQMGLQVTLLMLIRGTSPVSLIPEPLDPATVPVTNGHPGNSR